jgi:hypothetical protein
MVAQEVSLISEEYQYGGTPDTIALVGNGLGLLEFKTSREPYRDHLIAMAAYGQLWNENHPNQPVTGFHLIILPKDGSRFQYHAYADLSRYWREFELYLELYRSERDSKPFVRKSAKRKPERPKQLRHNVQATMGEILRAYGHVKECLA